MKKSTYTENWNYIAISIVVVAIITIMVIYLSELREFDMGILKIIRKFLNQFPNYIPIFFSNYGGVGNFLWPQITAGAVLISHQKYLKTFLLIFFTQGSYFLVDVIKDIVCRQRPCEYAGYSFPSCHTVTTTCFYGILIYLTNRYVINDFWRICLSVLFCIMIFMVALSRLWLGVHFLTDVVAGLFLGFVLVNLCIILDKFFSKN